MDDLTGNWNASFCCFCLMLMLSAILVFIGTFTYNREKVSLDFKKKARLVFYFYSNVIIIIIIIMGWWTFLQMKSFRFLSANFTHVDQIYRMHLQKNKWRYKLVITTSFELLSVWTRFVWYTFTVNLLQHLIKKQGLLISCCSLEME